MIERFWLVTQGGVYVENVGPTTEEWKCCQSWNEVESFFRHWTSMCNKQGRIQGKMSDQKNSSSPNPHGIWNPHKDSILIIIAAFYLHFFLFYFFNIYKTVFTHLAYCGLYSVINSAFNTPSNIRSISHSPAGTIFWSVEGALCLIPLPRSCPLNSMGQYDYTAGNVPLQQRITGAL